MKINVSLVYLYGEDFAGVKIQELKKWIVSETRYESPNMSSQRWIPNFVLHNFIQIQVTKGKYPFGIIDQANIHEPVAAS